MVNLRSRLFAAFVAAFVLNASAACRNRSVDHLQAARDATFEGKPQDALKHYLAAIQAVERDTSVEAQLQRARALKGAADIYYLELRDVKNAVLTYRELISAAPEAPETLEAHLHLADLLKVHYSDLRGAIGELAAALARNPPQSAELNYRVAKLYFELGDYKQAEIEAQNILKKYETSGFVDDATFLQAQAIAMMEGRRADAIRALQALIERFPDSDLQPHALYELGKVQAEAGDDPKAIELWVEALKRHPDPQLVQSSISRVRARITATTPVKIGSEAAAFDHGGRIGLTAKLPPRGPAPRPSSAKTSVEAAGGTAEEAARDRGD